MAHIRDEVHPQPPSPSMTWPAILERGLWTAFDAVIGTFAVEAVLETPLPVLSVAGVTTLVSFVKNIAVQRLQVLGRIK